MQIKYNGNTEWKLEFSGIWWVDKSQTHKAYAPIFQIFRLMKHVWCIAIEMKRNAHTMNTERWTLNRMANWKQLRIYAVPTVHERFFIVDCDCNHRFLFITRSICQIEVKCMCGRMDISMNKLHTERRNVQLTNCFSIKIPNNDNNNK